MKNICILSAAAVLVSAASCSVDMAQSAKPSKDLENPRSSLLLLENDRIAVGILPAVGAHVVMFRTKDGGNLLNSDARLWTAPLPNVTAEPPPFLPYNGHIYWLGPQKGWWQQQDLNADRRDRKATWPPDPYLTLGKYEILEQTKESVKLRSPQSPVSGIQMTKEISLKDGKVFLKVTAVNIRNKDVSWGIWSNTRLPGNASVYVPVGKEGGVLRVEFTAWNPEKERILPYEITDGFLHFDIPSVAADKEHVFTSKTFIYPSEPLIAAFSNGYLFIKRSSLIPKNTIHPDQSFVEIYKLTGNLKDTLTELEMQGAYAALKPGESMSFEEDWELIPCGDLSGTAERIKFLKEKLK